MGFRALLELPRNSGSQPTGSRDCGATTHLKTYPRHCPAIATPTETFLSFPKLRYVYDNRYAECVRVSRVQMKLYEFEHFESHTDPSR